MSDASSDRSQHFHDGGRVRLSGGYDMDPAWLGGRSHFDGTLVRFIPGQNQEPAAVVQTDEPVTVDGTTGSLLVLELRYEGATWGTSEVVHIELCDFDPEDKRWQDRRRGKWVESNATIEVLA